MKTENLGRKKKGKREYPNNRQTKEPMKKLNNLFESKVDIPRIRAGKRQTFETLISE